MTDVHDKATRSYNMSRIRCKDTKPEMLVRRYLHAQGYRYTLHNRNLPGKPDIVLPKYKTVIFIHGCFWHGHNGCKNFVMPKTRNVFWENKITENRKRDIKSSNALKKYGWKVLTVWECQLKSRKLENTLNRLAKKLVDKKTE